MTTGPVPPPEIHGLDAVRAIAATATLTVALAAGPVQAEVAGPRVEPDPARRAALVELVRQDCGSCHGLRLTGGLGPPLTAEALRERPPESIAATIVHGRRGTAMPPWKRFMNEDEARWLATILLEGRIDAAAR